MDTQHAESGNRVNRKIKLGHYRLCSTAGGVLLDTTPWPLFTDLARFYFALSSASLSILMVGAAAASGRVRPYWRPSL